MEARRSQRARMRFDAGGLAGGVWHNAPSLTLPGPIAARRLLARQARKGTVVSAREGEVFRWSSLEDEAPARAWLRDGNGQVRVKAEWCAYASYSGEAVCGTIVGPPAMYEGTIRPALIRLEEQGVVTLVQARTGGPMAEILREGVTYVELRVPV